MVRRTEGHDRDPTQRGLAKTPLGMIDDEAYRASFIRPGKDLRQAREALRSIRERERWLERWR
jgi:hypothetical protein